MFPFLKLGEEGGEKAKSFLKGRKDNEIGAKRIHTNKIIMDKKCSSFPPSLLWKPTEFDPVWVSARYRVPQQGSFTEKPPPLSPGKG